MSKNREIEAKTLLSPKVYQQILAAFPLKQDFVQENYYFDTPDSVLKKARISLRIRIFKDHAEQTMKVPDPHPVQNNFHEVIEINDNLTVQKAKQLVDIAQKEQMLIFSGNIGNYLNEHFLSEQKNLRLFTWSKTHRNLSNGPQNCELTLDETSYPDGYQDYELEIENTNPAMIKVVQQELEKQYQFSQTADNRNQNKIARAAAHRK